MQNQIKFNDVLGSLTIGNILLLFLLNILWLFVLAPKMCAKSTGHYNDKQLTYATGFLKRESKTIKLNEINNIESTQGIFGVGKLTVILKNGQRVIIKNVVSACEVDQQILSIVHNMDDTRQSQAIYHGSVN